MFSQRHHEQLSAGLGFRCETWSHQDLTISRVTPTIHTATSSSHGPLASYWPCWPQRPRNKAGTVRGPARAAPRGSVDADSRPRHAHPAARPRGCSSQGRNHFPIVFQFVGPERKAFSKSRHAAVGATATLVGPVAKPEHKPRKRMKSSAQRQARSRVPCGAAADVSIITSSSTQLAFSAGWILHTERDLRLSSQGIMANTHEETIMSEHQHRAPSPE